VQAEWLVFFAKPMEKRPTRVCCRRDSQRPSPMNFALYYFLRFEVFGSRQLIVPVFTSCHVEMRILVRKIRVSIHIGGKVRGAASRCVSSIGMERGWLDLQLVPSLNSWGVYAPAYFSRQ
jgi:hypothetical protein